MPSDKLFDSLADQMQNVVDAVHGDGDGAYVIPDIADIQKVYDSLNKELTNLDKLDEADFAIKKSNEFYFTGMYLKAVKMQNMSRKEAVLSELTQASGLGDKASFVRKEYKELKKRLTP